MKTKPHHLAIAIAIAASPAGATITVHHHWEFGEGATAGTDAIGSAHLTTVGATTNAPGAPGSTTSQNFVNTASEGTATNYMTYGGSLAAGLTAAGNNWGVEVWANTNVLGGAPLPGELGLLHIGGTGQPAIALEVFNDQWLVHRPGAAFETQGSVTVGEWTHLVYLGTGEVYLNGVLSGGSSPGATLFPTLPSGAPSFTVGSMWVNNRRGWDGEIDDLRLFTFDAGEFDISDTLATGIPEPSSLGLLALGSLALMRRRNR